MQKRKLGIRGPEAAEIGHGAMGLFLSAPGAAFVHDKAGDYGTTPDPFDPNHQTGASHD